VYYNVELEELKGRDIINIREFLPDSLTILEKEIIYFRLYNYTFREISEYYGININTIKSKYGRIIKKIQIANRVDI
jgi:DNA-binding CsgD family transcriptional regulator